MKATRIKFGADEKRLTEWCDIPGHVYAKRAVEVALTGNHSFCLIATNDTESESILTIAARISQLNLGDKKFHGMVVPVCSCGNYSNATRACTCSADDIKRHWKNQLDMTFDIFIEVQPPTQRDIAYTDMEADAMMTERIQRARSLLTTMKNTVISKESQNLLQVAITKLGFGFWQVIAVRSVARTIAALANCQHIRSEHISEAIQYQSSECISFMKNVGTIKIKR